ncbi:hypothetical protein R1sor_002725 [Riccia sorocarpa]|uniref:Reverse transcriptase domain-containing protein n=1 Tax=Riccia sorocarpa TaxID=122646 RepID=A0ABD3GZZ8_9MARC
MLREEEAHGRRKGVSYGGTQTLLHQIYADDTGVDLTMDESQLGRLKDVIHVYETISGAKHNVSKSLIMPIGPSAPPDWINGTGCEVARPGRGFIYLEGWTDQDNPNVSLVAWERITQSRSDGGLGWTALKIKPRCCRLKNMVKLMSESNAEWMMLARSLILRTLRSGGYQRERQQWRVSDALLLTSLTKIKGSRTLTRMVMAWNTMKKKLKWDDTWNEVPAHRTIEQGIGLLHWVTGKRLQVYEG